MDSINKSQVKTVNGIDAKAYRDRYYAWSQLNPSGFRTLPNNMKGCSKKGRKRKTYLIDKCVMLVGVN